SGASYPEGPYGSSVSDVAPNVCVQAWRDPLADDYDTSKLKRICLADFYDPDRTAPGLLLINTGALWCTACQIEYRGTGNQLSLGDETAARRERGFETLGVLF